MIKVICLVTFIAFTISCGITNHKRFTFYKQEFKNEESFRKDGVYFRHSGFIGGIGDERFRADIYFFYGDGSFKSISTDVADSSLETLRSKMTADFYKRLVFLEISDGAYQFRGDSLITQIFIGTKQRGIYSMDIAEEFFLVNKSRPSIQMVGSFCKWCPKKERVNFGKTLIDEHYQFLPLQSKPDSSKFWFKKKKWYKEGVKFS